MDTKTLFEAYKKCRDLMEWEVDQRPLRGKGIAFVNDGYALRWQRYDRLARRIGLRIHGCRHCPICATPAPRHEQGCRNEDRWTGKPKPAPKPGGGKR